MHHEDARQTRHRLIVQASIEPENHNSRCDPTPEGQKPGRGPVSSQGGASPGRPPRDVFFGVGEGVSFTRHDKAVRHWSSGFRPRIVRLKLAFVGINADHRPSQAEFVCQACGHTGNVVHHAAVAMTQRGIPKRPSRISLTATHQAMRIVRKAAAAHEPGTSGRDPENPVASASSRSGGGRGHSKDLASWSHFDMMLGDYRLGVGIGSGWQRGDAEKIVPSREW